MKSYKDLTPDEKSIVNKLLSEGHDVKLMPEIPNVGKTYDLLVDGIATELKTLNSSNINTLITKVGRALDQLDGNGDIIYDISKANFTPSQMEEIMSRLIGKYGEDLVNKIIFIK